MSAGGPKPGAQVATVIATALDPSILPSWLDRIAAKGPLQAPAYFERLYKKIEETESERLNGNTYSAGEHGARVNLYSTRASSERGNLRRNRYTDIVPYDRYRVPLRHPSPVIAGNGAIANPPRYSDYINASFLDTTPSADENGSTSVYGKQYISTQGPLPETVRDFWAMIWDQNVRVIVMLTKEEERGRPKCHRYWPSEEAAPLLYPYGSNELDVQSRGKQTLPSGEVTVRELHLRLKSKNGEEVDSERVVWHIQFLNWPDHKSSSARSVLEVIDLANSLQQRVPAAGPMLVHCSAGCGRTGTFCTIDSVLYQMQSGMFLKDESSRASGKALRFHLESSDNPDDLDDPVLACVMRLRERRVAMVQTLEQFAFCYEAVVARLIDWSLSGHPITWTTVEKPSARNPTSAHVTPGASFYTPPSYPTNTLPNSAAPTSSAGSTGGPLSSLPQGIPTPGAPRSAGGWGRTSSLSYSGGNLETLPERSPSRNSPGVPPTPLVPPTPGPSGIAFDWDAALRKVADA
ncbi:hypothetical protein HDU96_008027 [Phlyctochytrium bullatum]|nr:hypothetical protein HDU96_008027 [Phlyctochytrium bullatum]